MIGPQHQAKPPSGGRLSTARRLSAHLSSDLLRTVLEVQPYTLAMDRAEAVRLLPETYARALILRDQGCGHIEIAAALGIVPEAIGPLLRLAEAKVQQLLDTPPEVREHLGLLAASLEDLAEAEEAEH